MNIFSADVSTISILGGLVFIFIAIVGGGFTIKEIKIPPVPKWMRVLSFIVGLGLVFISFIPFNNDGLGNGNDGPTPTPTITTTIGPKTIYSDNEPDTTIHNITLIKLAATCTNDPPKIGDRIIVEFILKNVDDNPIILIDTFIAARDPDGENRDFGTSNEGKTILPQDKVTIKESIIVDEKGIWEFGPCYSLDIPEIIDENNLCPTEWRRFEVYVV